MKIAYIAIRGVPLSDGIVQYTDSVAKQMVEKGHCVTVYASKRYGNKTGLYNGYRIITVPSFPWGFAEKMSLVFFASINQLFKKFDIVHYHAMGPSIFAFLSRITGKCTVIQSHGIEYNRAKFGKKTKWLLRKLEKWSINIGDELLACSNALHKHFLTKYGKETVVIHNAVVVPELFPSERKYLDAYGVADGQYYLYMGRLTEEKGLPYLIQAYKKLKTNKKLIIAGPYDTQDAYHKHLFDMASDDSRISFIGFVTGQQKVNLLRGAYAFCLPSESEGFSVALLEAMSYAICCIVSNIPNNIEATGDFAVSFESRNEYDLYQALEKVENNPELAKKLGKMARIRVQNNFSEDLLVDKTELFYMNILERKKKKRRGSREETQRIQKALDYVSSINDATRKTSILSEEQTSVL